MRIHSSGSLKLIPLDIKTGDAVPTADCINIYVDSAVNVKVGSTSEMVEIAAQNFLNKSTEEIGDIVTEVLEGNIREIICTMKLRELIGDRKTFVEGEFVYGWDGKELVLVPVESSDYKEIQEKNRVIHNNTFIKARDLIIGATYEDLNGNQYVYMGKSKPWKNQSNYYYHESRYYYSNNRKEGYEYPLDDTWLISKCRSSYYNKNLTYYRSIQEEKKEFFFILLGNPSAEYSWYRENRVTHMKTITRKFTHMVLEKRPDYPDMVNLLYSNAEYCQEDFEADKLIDLPYDIFVAMAQETIEKCLKHNWYGDDFVVGKEKDELLGNIKVYYEKESGKWYIMDTIIETYEEKKWFSSEMETKTREQQVKKYFDNLEECYQYIHPVYGEHYLKNGYLEKRYYYGTEK